MVRDPHGGTVGWRWIGSHEIAGDVARPALLARLNQGLSRRLTLVSAPAGAGKTTLLAQWATQLSDPVIWFSCRDDDNRPTVFLAHLLAALKGEPEALRESSVDLDASAGELSGSAFRAALVGIFGEMERDSVLIVDDLHVITSQTVLSTLADLVDGPGVSLHLVLSTRTDPPFRLAHHRSQGQLTEIRGPDLAFSSLESKAFFHDCVGLGISSRESDLIHARTEGWAAGLRLGALALAESGDVDGVTFGGEHPYVFDYFCEEVLAGLPSDVRSFLVRTSIAGSFCAGLCEALTGHGHAMLREIRARNLFLVALDEQARWFRYHHCFAETLARLLEEEGVDTVRELHLAAMRWYLQRGMMREVVHHALAAGEYYAAADAIERQVDELIWERGEIAGLLSWLAALPGHVMRSRPRLCMAHAWALALTGQLEALDDHLAIAEQSLLRLSLTGVSIPSLPVQETSTRLAPTILGELAAVRAVGAGSRVDTNRLELSSTEAIAYDPQNPFLSSVLALSRARAYDLAAGVRDAVRAYAEARDLSESIGNTHIQAVASSRLAELWAVQGDLHESANAHQSVLRMAEHDLDRRSAMGAMSHVGLGSLLYEWNQLDAAEEHFDEGIEQALRWGHLETLKGAYFGLSRVRFAQRAIPEAFELLDEAETLARHSNAPRSLVWVRAMQARLHITQGNLAAAAHWYETCDLTPERYPLRLYTGEYSTIARLLTAQAEYDAALDLIDHLSRVALAEHWMGLTIELLVLRALLLHARGTFRASLPPLRKALSLAAPEGYLRTFLDEGAPLASLFERASAQSGMPPYLAVVSAAFQSTRGEHAPRVGPLTPREREVLHHLAAGETNHEIAERLVLSLATVKRHVSNIYFKLDVASRTQAAAKARDLHLT